MTRPPMIPSWQMAQGAEGQPGPSGDPGPPGTSSDRFYLPEDYGDVDGTGATSDLEALQAATDAAHDAGGGTVVLWQRYGIDGPWNIRGGVCVYQLSVPQLEAPAQDELGIVCLTTDAQVMYGQGGSGGSTNDNPGELRNLYVDGADVGGTDDALFVCDASNAALYNLNVRHSAGHGIDIGSSQNLTFYNIHSGEHHNGTALLFKSRSLGRQGPGGNKIYGGHVGDSYLPLHVTSNEPAVIDVEGVPTLVADFSPPHDNIIEGVLWETGRVDDDAVIRCNGVFEAGETMLRSCVATAGTHVTENEEDCCYLVDNPIFTGYSTTVTFDSCYFGGGAGTIKATDAVRVMQSGAFNEVRMYGRTQLANVDYVLCADGAHLGAGSDLVASIQSPVLFVTGGISWYRLINAAGTSGALTGLVEQRITPSRFVMPAGLGNVFQARREGDVANRIQIDRDGGIRHLNAATGATVASIINAGAGYLISGETAVQIAAFTTALRPAASNALYLHKLILDTTLNKLIWSDGTNWRDAMGTAV